MKRQNCSMLFFKKSFTLIELTLVIAIIAILATIAIPNVSRFIRKSRDAKRLSDMQVLALAIEGFYDDFAQYPSNNNVGAPAGTPNVSCEGECIGTRGQAVAGSTCAAQNRKDMALDQRLRPYIRGPIPRDPLYDNRGAEFFYIYDPSHPVDWPTQVTWDIPNDNTACIGGIPAPYEFRALLGFRRAETQTIDLHKDSCQGTEGQLDSAHYNLAFGEEGPGC